MKSEKPISLASPSAPKTFKVYFLAARPKTWIASLSPVFIGTVMAPRIDVSIFILTLLFSWLIQVGTNYANDYFDFVNGVDSPLRNGPKRATQEGWISPTAMITASLVVFSAALLIAIPLIMTVGLWSLILAIFCVAFGILYTGGPKPLGYLGLGELLVLIFFGPVATCGSFFLQTATLNTAIFLASFAPGLLSCSILIANNLRDEKNDCAAGKQTLIVRFGRTFGSRAYALSIFTASAIPLLLIFFFHFPHILALSSLIFPISIPWIKKAFSFRNPLELISVLQGSSFILLLYTVLFCLTLLIGTT